MKTLEDLTQQYSLTAEDVALVKFAGAIMYMGRSMSLGVPDLEPVVQRVVAAELAEAYGVQHDMPLPFSDY